MNKLDRIHEVIKWIIYEGQAKNQTDLAEQLGYTKSSFSQIINGKVNLSDLFIRKLTTFAPLINPAWIQSGEGQMLIESTPITSNNTPTPDPNYYDTEATVHIDDANPEMMYNSHGNKFTFYPDGRIYIEVLKIPFSAHASYVTRYNDDVVLRSEFDSIQFRVDKFGLGHYMAFDVVGDSMNGGSIDDTPNGAEVLGREVNKHLWNGGFHNTRYGFIVITKEATFHKDITAYNVEDGLLTLSSRNSAHPSFVYPVDDVYQIFHVIKRIF
ncbi:MAG: helix-turn-helix transcriptional regulator [Flavobacteriaceae bacterium]|jgi:phage repressor protein C with HTH and peptisase S24 domain|nr:helix-turn-helix transcriptional regulator [Flavobacteriaceae bacterium]